MKGLLIRVGADQSLGGGKWNAPVDLKTKKFVYVPIPETKPLHPGQEKPYAQVCPDLDKLGVELPERLQGKSMHLDPDFDYSSYGDQGRKAKQLSSLVENDFIVFYAGLRDIHTHNLEYCLIGMLTVSRIELASNIQEKDRAKNAHSRRVISTDANDLVVWGTPSRSGRFAEAIPFGEYRDRAYRIRRDVLEDWGGISARDGYIHRCGTLPSLLHPESVLSWVRNKDVGLLQTNNPEN